jgi:L-fucose dehydrogenase
MDMQLKEKVILVAAGATGIGAAIVRACTGEGAIPVIVDRDIESGQRLQAELRVKGPANGLISIDLSNAEGCSQAVDHAVKTFGRIDALVNNAEVNDRIGLERGNPSQFVDSLGRDLLHFYNMAHYALPHLKRSRGSIVNISSGASVQGAIMSLTREWAAELLGYDIRVNAVLSARQRRAPDGIVSMAMFLISANASHITGQHLFVDSGLCRNEVE